jgi:hypothetical protein
MRKIYLVFLFFLFSVAARSQDSLKTRSFTFEVSAGGLATSFQDTKYSNLKYSGIGGVFGFDFQWRKKAIIAFGARGIYSKEKAKTFDHGKTNLSNGQFNFRYLYPIKTNKDYKIFVGAKADIVDFTLRMTPELTNNAAYVIQGGGLKAYSLFEKRINDKWLLNAGVGFQLFAIMDEYMSFAYMANQHLLENGDYNYEDPEMPLFFTPLWEF